VYYYYYLSIIVLIRAFSLVVVEYIISIYLLYIYYNYLSNSL